MRVKNTFLELDLPPTDLRRLETCPGRVDQVPKGTMLSAPKENLKKSWADMESDDEETASGSVEKSRWADMDSDDETPCQKKGSIDRDGFLLPSTPPEPEAETSPRNSKEPVVDEWCTVQRKGKSKGSAVRKEVSPEPMPYKSAPARQERRPTETRRAPERQAPPRAVNGQVAKRVDVNMVDGPFPVVRRLIGPGGANLRKIKDACGAVLSLRGKGCPGSGPASEREGPLHIVISARPQDLATAVQMTEQLIADVRAAKAHAA
jgi:hypothetical protein